MVAAGELLGEGMGACIAPTGCRLRVRPSGGSGQPPFSRPEISVSQASALPAQAACCKMVQLINLRPGMLLRSYKGAAWASDNTELAAVHGPRWLPAPLQQSLTRTVEKRTKTLSGSYSRRSTSVRTR